MGSRPKEASPYDMLDMAGNVWEWVADWFSWDYYSRSPRHNPPGPDSSAHRVLRGGSGSRIPKFVRCAFRLAVDPDGEYYDWGFRCTSGSE